MPLTYLQSLEYNMGNGQCPECSGVSSSWHGHPCHRTPESIGHTTDCRLAGVIVSAGGKVIFKNSLSELPLGPRYREGSVLHAYYNSEEYKTWVKESNEQMDELMFKCLTQSNNENVFVSDRKAANYIK